jgi:hypothetical protein
MDDYLGSQLAGEAIPASNCVPGEVLLSNNNHPAATQETLQRLCAKKRGPFPAVANEMCIYSQCMEHVARRPAPEIWFVIIEQRPKDNRSTALYQDLRMRVLYFAGVGGDAHGQNSITDSSSPRTVASQCSEDWIGIVSLSMATPSKSLPSLATSTLGVPGFAY